MRSSRVIHVVSAHAEGEVGDVVVGGVMPPPGGDLWAQRSWIAADGGLRDLLLNEPRGGVFRHVNLLVPPRDPRADAAFIVMEPEDTPPMSGSNAICVTTVLLESGLIPMTEPVTELLLEAPGGPVRVRAQCRQGRVRSVTLRNLPSFADRLDAVIEVEGLGSLTVDIAFGGDSFVIVDAAALGFSVTADEAADMARLGMRITRAADAQLGFRHPVLKGWDHISFCNFTTPLEAEGEALRTRSAVVIRPGRLDRSPCGTGVSARMAVLAARGRLRPGRVLETRSVIGSRFLGRIVAETALAGRPAIVPEITGRGWITGIHQHMLDPDDPWPRGYRLSDSWGVR